MTRVLAVQEKNTKSAVANKKQIGGIMNKTKGLTFGILAAFIYGFTPILGKLTYFEGSNSISLTFYRNFLSIPLIFAVLKYKNVPISVN